MQCNQVSECRGVPTKILTVNCSCSKGEILKMSVNKEFRIKNNRRGKSKIIWIMMVTNNILDLKEERAFKEEET